MTDKETRVVPLPSGNLLVSPSGTQDITVQCGKKYHKQSINEDTRVTLPRGCTGIIGNHVFTANPLSPIIEPPASWQSKTALIPIPNTNELVPHETFNGNGPIITFPDQTGMSSPRNQRQLLPQACRPGSRTHEHGWKKPSSDKTSRLDLEQPPSSQSCIAAVRRPAGRASTAWLGP
jgi:hypothetical protein